MKKWKAPKLIVLVRGEPEENLVIVCKHYMFINGPDVEQTACRYYDDLACLDCVTYAAS